MLSERWKLAGCGVGCLAVALAAGAVAVSLHRPGEAAGPGDGEWMPQASPAANAVVLADASPGRRPGPVEPTESSLQWQDPEGAPPETGTVAGMLTTTGGQPIPGRRIRLGGRWSSTRTDGDGLFRFEEVPVGPEDIYVDVRPPAIGEDMLVRVATTRVFAARESWVPAVLEAGRTLSGRMLMTDAATRAQHPGSHGSLLLELRTRSIPPETVAWAVVSTTASVEPKPLPEPDQLYELGFDDYESFARAAKDPNDPPEFVIGSFRFEHLPPDIYRLHITPDGNEVIHFELDGVPYRADLYEERNVDLTYGDVELPLEEFTLQGFLQQAVDRDGLVPAETEGD